MGHVTERRPIVAMASPSKQIELMEAVERLGKLRARMADLKAEEAQLTATLEASGLRVVEGDLFRATVSTGEVRNVAWKAIAEHLEPSRQLVAAHTEIKSRTTVKVVSRNGRGQ